jgi:hypothetical protein
MKKLSESETERLFQFTRQHFVEHYDLRQELVVQLSDAIEKLWIENPNLSFDEALTIEFKKYGIFGFQDFVEKKRTEMTKIYNKFIIQNCKSFFTWTNSAVTVLAILLLYWILGFEKAVDIAFFSAAILFLTMFFYHHYSINKRKKEVGFQHWLLDELITYCGDYSYILILIPQILLRVDKLDSIFLQAGISVLLILSIVFTYILKFQIPKKADTYLKLTYPEYNTVARPIRV